MVLKYKICEIYITVLIALLLLYVVNISCTNLSLMVIIFFAFITFQHMFL